MKKIVSVIAVSAALSCVCSCGPKEDPNGVPTAEHDRLEIVASIFPEYDWVREIVGDNDANITLILDDGVDLHSYQPTAEDILKISNCDMFVYVGGESDKWIDDVIKDSANDDMVVLNLLDILGGSAKKEELAEGMQGENDGYDEHIWLSLKNAETLCGAIANSLAELDRENASSYIGNADAYIEKLSALDNEYREAVNSAPVKTILVGDRFPFRYMTDEYGLDYYAAFSGCSAETEASFETIMFLSDKANELGLNHIIKTESSDGKIAETIKRNTGVQDILTLDSMQSVTSQDIANGETYISITERNLDVLKKALQ